MLRRRFYHTLLLCALASALQIAAVLRAEDDPLNRGRSTHNKGDDSDDDPGAAPKKPAEPKAKADAPSNPAQQKIPAPPAAPPAAQNNAPAAPPVCPRCHGLGIVPLAQRKPYIRLAGEPAGDPSISVPWDFCPVCQKSHSAKEIAATEKSRLTQLEHKQDQRNQKLNLKLLGAETRHFTFYSPFPAAKTRTICECIEKLTDHLQTVTKSTLLVSLRPDTSEIIYTPTHAAYEASIDKLIEAPAEYPAPPEYIALARKCAALPSTHLTLCDNVSVPPEDAVTFDFAKMLIWAAISPKRPPDWLQEGFAAYCENTVMHRNLVYAIDYEFSTVALGANWNSAVKQLAKTNQLRKWDDLFLVSFIHAKPADYLLCYSAVSFLIRADPERFNQFILNIREGLDSKTAVERAYGRSLREIESAWAVWVLSQ